MNKIFFLKRTQTAGANLRSSELADNKGQTFTQITQIQEDEAKVTKQYKMLELKQKQLIEELREKERRIEEKRYEIIKQLHPSNYQSKTPETDNQNMRNDSNERLSKKPKMRRQEPNLKFNISYLKQQENELVSQKVHLKKEIDRMRREKNMFLEIQKKIVKLIEEMDMKLCKQTKELSSTYEQIQAKTGISYQFNEKQQLKMDSDYKKLQKQTFEQMKKLHVQEVRRFGYEFKTMLNQFDSKDRHPYLKKQKDSPDSPHSQSEEKDFDYDSQKIEMLHLDETVNRKKKQMIEREIKAQQNLQEQQVLQQLQSQADIYDQTFKNLKDQTKSNEMDEIVNIFVDQEESNYAQFKYIYGLSEDLDMLEKTQHQLLQEQEELLLRPKRLEEDPKYKQELLIKQKISDVKQKTEKLQHNYTETTKILKELMISIPIMFERIDCKQKDYAHILGQNFSFKDMDEDKLIRVLAAIEVRTNDILQMQDIAQNPRMNFLRKEPKQSELKKIEELGGFQDQVNKQAQEDQFYKAMERGFQVDDKQADKQNEKQADKLNEKYQQDKEFYSDSQFKKYAEDIIKQYVGGKKSRR